MGKRLSKQKACGEEGKQGRRIEQEHDGDAAEQEQAAVEQQAAFEVASFDCLYSVATLNLQGANLQGSFLPSNLNFNCHITILDLSQNLLEEVDCIVQLRGLQDLNLRNNVLKRLPALNFPHLHRMDISSNCLQTLPVLDHTPLLQTVLAANNKFQPELAVWIIKDRREVERSNKTIKVGKENAGHNSNF